MVTGFPTVPRTLKYMLVGGCGKIPPEVKEGVKVCLCVVLFIDQVFLGHSLDQLQT